MSGSSHPIVFSRGRLSYISQDALRIPTVLSKMYGNITVSLDLSFNKICNLDEVEKFSILTELVLDNNEINDSMHLLSMPYLHTLSLNNNNITNLTLLVQKIKTNLPKLEYLSLLGNIACPNELSDSDKNEDDYQRYRYYVLHHLPNLKFLDSRTVNQEEWLEGKRRGQYMNIVRPTFQSFSEDYDSDEKYSHTPLPFTEKNLDHHQAVYSRCWYVYTGQQSEGNRFIRSSDL